MRKAEFNSRLQVTELNLGHGLDGDLWRLGYEYGEIDANNNVDPTKNSWNIARQTLSFIGLAQAFVQTYIYDSLQRLKEAVETSGTGTGAPQVWKESYGYDRYGNRSFHSKFSGTNQLTATKITDPTINQNTNRFDDGQDYSYDHDGNLTADAESRGFTFNADNKQTKVTQNGITVGEYYFDGEGKRVKKIVYDPNGSGAVTEVTVFVYSSGKLIGEYSTNPPRQNPTTSYTATDQLGSPRVITNALGQVVSRRDFMPFGEEIVPDTNYRTASLTYTSADSVRQKFTGYQKDDETGLDFAEARMYENRHGRFTAVDPLLASGKSANPQTFNRFTYCMNRPLAVTDIQGLQAATVPDSNASSFLENITIRIYTVIDKTGQYLSDLFAEGREARAGYLANGTSSKLDEINFQRGRSRWDATTGSVEVDYPYRRLIGNQGPTTDSVIQQTTDNYRAAMRYWEYGSALQGLTSLIPVPGGSATMASDSGLVGEEAAPTAGSIELINPTGSQTNCVNCAIATDATLSGRPASALPDPTGEGVPITELEKIFSGRFTRMTQDQIESTLANQGNGAKGIVYAARTTTDGHVFNGANQNGTVRFLDGQTGRPADWKEYRYFMFLPTNFTP